MKPLPVHHRVIMYGGLRPLLGQLNIRQARGPDAKRVALSQINICGHPQIFHFRNTRKDIFL